MATSPRFKMTGWDWKKWISGNKEVLKIAIPAIAAWLITQNVITTGISAIVVKAVFDIVDFYVTEVKL